jgi:GNAT superfamily N-acetyltransferase
VISSLSKIRIEHVSKGNFTEIEPINRFLFNEHRIINRTDHKDLIILKACSQDIIIGFKVGYGRAKGVFYSAKGGVLPAFRRLGIARQLMDEMMQSAALLGYTEFQYDTFPNMHPGMLILGINEGFKIVETRYNAQYKDFQITLMKPLQRD